MSAHAQDANVENGGGEGGEKGISIVLTALEVLLALY